MDECLENDDSMLAREPDIKFAVDNVEVVHGYMDEKSFDRRDDSIEDLNQHEQQLSRSLHAEFRNEDNAMETKSDLDQDRTQSPFNDDKHYQGEMDELRDSNFFKTSSQSKSQTFDNETGTEDSPNSQEFPLTENTNQGARDSDLVRPPRTGRARNICSEKSQGDLISSSIHEIEREASDLQTRQSLSSSKSYWLDNEPNKDDSPGENRMPQLPQPDFQFCGRTARGSISSMTRRQMSISPEGSPSPLHSFNGQKHISPRQGSPDPSYEPRLHRTRISSPPERSDVSKGVSPDHVSPARQTSASTHGIQQEPLYKDRSAVKHISASQKSHHSPPKYRKRERSESRSPIQHRGSPTRHRGSHTRHRDSSTRHRDSLVQHRDSNAYQRDYRNRSRSRSPYSRSHHRSRSPYSRSHHRSRSPYSRDHHRSRSPYSSHHRSTRLTSIPSPFSYVKFYYHQCRLATT